MTTFERWATIGEAVARSASAVNVRTTDANRQTTYALLGSLYANEATLQTDRGVLGVRTYNPVHRVVEWYAGRVFGDVWTDDGLPLPDGTPSTVPFAEDVDEPVRLAAMQALYWSNWQKLRFPYVRFGAMFGDVFLKPTLDVAARKVYVQVFEPRYVTDLQFNNRGDVIAYRLDYPVEDDNLVRSTYIYGESWTKESFTTYRDGRPTSFDGLPVTQENPFGFVPGVWVNHRSLGGIHGAPAVDGVIPKIQELNALVDATHTYIGKMHRQPVGISSSGKWGADITILNDNKNSVGTFKGPADMTIHRLIDNIGLADSLQYIKELMTEIEKDLPETTMDERLAAMQQVTGPGATRILGDTAYRLYEAEGNYDSGLIDASQMCISIGAYAVKSGLWGRSLNEAQRKFAAFDLTSYDRGQLAMNFLMRPLVPETALERIQEAGLRETIKTRQGLTEIGYDPETVDRILADRSATATTSGSLFGSLLNAGAA